MTSFFTLILQHYTPPKDLELENISVSQPQLLRCAKCQELRPIEQFRGAYKAVVQYCLDCRQFLRKSHLGRKSYPGRRQRMRRFSRYANDLCHHHKLPRCQCKTCSRPCLHGRFWSKCKDCVHWDRCHHHVPSFACPICPWRRELKWARLRRRQEREDRQEEMKSEPGQEFLEEEVLESVSVAKPERWDSGQEFLEEILAW